SRASHFYPRSAPPGPPEATRRCCATRSTGNGCRRPPRWHEALELTAGGAMPVAAAVAIGPWETLTLREREVASMLARGCTNRQVATELVITEATAKRHVATTLSKLGLTSPRAGRRSRRRELADLRQLTHLSG